MPPPAPIFWEEVDENQVSYFIWPYVIKVCIISQEILVMHYVDCDSGTVQSCMAMKTIANGTASHHAVQPPQMKLLGLLYALLPLLSRTKSF